MAYEFQKLSEVEALAEVPEGANALIEVNGDIKRVPGSGLGGATGIKTAIIKDSEYDNMVAGMLNPAAPTVASSVGPTYECLNMTFEEAYEIMSNGEPLSVFGMLALDGAYNLYGQTVFVGIAMTGSPLIGLSFILDENNTIFLFWTADGISTEPPSSGGGPV